VVVATTNWSVLFGAPPSKGFEPLSGKDCPCWQPRGVRLVGDIPRLVQVVPRGDHLRLDPPPGPPPDGVLDAMVLTLPTALHGAPAGQLWAHEAFHVYQLAQGWFLNAIADVPAPSFEQASMLLDEQLLLARALRSAVPDRGRILAAWAALRAGVRKAGLEAASAQELERIEGTARYFELSVLGRVRGLRRSEVESRLAALLERGGRDLHPDSWFERERYYATGAALSALLDDAGANWRSELTKSWLSDLAAKLASGPERPRIASGDRVPRLSIFRGTTAPLAPATLTVLVVRPVGARVQTGAGSDEFSGKNRLGSGTLDFQAVGIAATVIRELESQDDSRVTLRIFGRRPAALAEAALASVAKGGRLECESAQLQIHAKRAWIERPTPGEIKLDFDGH
jgi:hypothetical protein